MDTPDITILKQLITKAINDSMSVDLLDLIYKLLIFDNT